jgi:hypothetical protein
MTTSEETKLTMYKDLLLLMKKNSSVTFTIPAFGNAINEFNGLVEQIKEKSMEVMKASSGKAVNKHDIQDELLDTLQPIISALYVYARKYNNTILKENIRLTEHDLKDLTDSELIAKSTSILKWANENLDALADDGIAIEHLNLLRKKIDTFKNLASSSDATTRQISEVRCDLHKLFDTADSLIKEDMDNLVEILKPANPQFFREYVSVRNIVNPGVFNN